MTDTGGPAYPVWNQEVNEVLQGVTVLDYSANNAFDRYRRAGTSRELSAREAYDDASAMIAEKRRRDQPSVQTTGEK